MSRNAGDGKEKKGKSFFFLNLALFGPWSWEQSGARGDEGRGKLSTRGCGLPYPPTRGSWILEWAC